MKDDQIAYGIHKIKQYGLITSGDAAELGIGGITEQRWTKLFNEGVKSGIFKPNTSYKEAFTLQFVNKRVQAYKLY